MIFKNDDGFLKEINYNRLNKFRNQINRKIKLLDLIGNFVK